MNSKCIAGVIKNEKGEILLENHVKTNAWTLPGGKLDKDEDRTRGLVRELFEELGILAYRYSVLGHKLIENREYPHGSGNFSDFEITIYSIDDYKGDIVNKEPQKHLELRYVKVEDIHKLERISGVLEFYLETIGK